MNSSHFSIKIKIGMPTAWMYLEGSSTATGGKDSKDWNDYKN